MSTEPWVEDENHQTINGRRFVARPASGCVGMGFPDCEARTSTSCANLRVSCARYARNDSHWVRWYHEDSPALAFFDKPEKDAALEQDPTGRDAHSPGAKLDQGKPRAALVLQDFGPALLRVADVGTFGAAKYTPHGWMSVPDGEERYLDAAMRHMLKQGADDDSGIDHLAHAAWNVLAALTLRIQAEEK